MTTTLSLLTPSGRLTLGNLLGRAAPDGARQDDAYYGLSDLHAMTTTHDPALLRARTTEMATLLLAAGLDRATLFRQSRVPAHAELAYLLECTAYTGELNRMIQFKEKGRGVDSTRVSLYTYPALMAADILLYRPPWCRSATTSDSTSSSPATWRCASTGRTARCSRSRRSRPRRPARG